MARARNIKPGVFTNELLGTLPAEITILFIGLWCLADRDGILEDRPLRIKAEIFPYRENIDINGYLTVMERSGFIQRYSSGGKAYIFVIEFVKHQSPHHTEKAKGYPKPPEIKDKLQSPLDNGETLVPSRSDSLIHGFTDSLIPDSLIADLPIPDSNPVSVASQPGQKKNTTAKKKPPDETALQDACKKTWAAYSEAYRQRYTVSPIRSATENSQIKQFCQKVPAEESPGVAAFYVRNMNSFYVQKGHPVGLLLADANKLRTEWVTQKTITQTEARNGDRIQAQGDVWRQLIDEEREKENVRTVN